MGYGVYRFKRHVLADLPGKHCSSCLLEALRSVGGSGKAGEGTSSTLRILNVHLGISQN